MAKKIWGVLLLLGGLTVTVLVAIAMAYDIPANFKVDGEGGERLVNLVVKYDLRRHILYIAVGLAMTLSSFVLLLSPRRVKVKAAAAVETPAADDATAETASSQAGETAPATPRLIQSYHTNLMGTGFANVGGRSRQIILRETKAGDVVACRTVAKRGEDETEIVGVFTVKGEQMGTIDVSVLRAIRETYPNHRIGVTVERISGGNGVPYTCAVRLGVYRS